MANAINELQYLEGEGVIAAIACAKDFTNTIVFVTKHHGLLEKNLGKLDTVKAHVIVHPLGLPDADPKEEWTYIREQARRCWANVVIDKGCLGDGGLNREDIEKTASEDRTPNVWVLV